MTERMVVESRWDTTCRVLAILWSSLLGILTGLQKTEPNHLCFFYFIYLFILPELSVTLHSQNGRGEESSAAVLMCCLLLTISMSYSRMSISWPSKFPMIWLCSLNLCINFSPCHSLTEIQTRIYSVVPSACDTPWVFTVSYGQALCSSLHCSLFVVWLTFFI